MSQDQEPAGAGPVFAIFRHADARPEDGVPIMRHAPMTDVAIAGGTRLMEAGIEHGHENRLLFAAGGISLTYVWFKSGYPLPRHAHDVDCLYYIVGGSLRLGTETLDKGDGFFIGGGVPYTYTPGPDGVEVLEFRTAGAFDINVLANNPAFWDRALRTVADHRDAWATEGRPSAIGDAC
jgi:hypothetical protein